MPVRIVAVGTNFITDRFIEACRRVEDARVVGILSRTEQRAREYAEKWDIPTPYWSAERVLADSSVDALYIATPNFAHFALARDAILAGKHVLVEKCITECHRDFVTLRNLAHERGVVLLEAMRPDFDEAHRALAAALPEVGRLRRASLEFCQYSSRYDAFLNGEVLRAFDPTIGNCALADIGIYPLHVALSLFGMPDTVGSQSVFLHNGFEGMGTATLAYEDGFLCSIAYSKITDGVRSSIIEGERGTLTINHITTPTRIVFHPRRADARVIYESDTPSDSMAGEIFAFARMVLFGDSAEPYLDRTDRTMRVYDTIVRQNAIFDHVSKIDRK